MKRASVKRSVHARLSCLCSGSENTGKMWKDGLNLARLIEDGSAHVLSGRCSTGVGSDSFWCKGSKALPNHLLEPSWWMLSWRGQTHQPAAPIAPLREQQFPPEKCWKHLVGSSDHLEVPFGGGELWNASGPELQLFNEQGKPFSIILHYILQGIF